MNINIPERVGLYVHLPWCAKKCPYCDFNSHQLRQELNEKPYIDALLNDFEFEIDRLEQTRIISSIFIGGGTPSLFSAESIDRLLRGMQNRCVIEDNVEVTLEANPGSADESRFEGYRQAGVNRLSIGIQSFNADRLAVLGRIHNREQAESAAQMARAAGFSNFNLDLMYCLPQQILEQAIADIEQAIALAPTHISAYQLTIEPNTLFAHQPPGLPNEHESWEIQQRYWSMLDNAGYRRYEISAYTKPGFECKHNLNYWRFGDYLGIGAGAHGKISSDQGIFRSLKPKHPHQYQQVFAAGSVEQSAYIKPVADRNLPLEYMMNKLRLQERVEPVDFERSTGMGFTSIRHVVNKAIDLQLLESDGSSFKVAEKGQLFLDDLLQLFLAENIEELQRCYG